MRANGIIGVGDGCNMTETDSFISSIIRAVEGTKSTAEISFEGMRIKLPGVNSYIEITGKVTFTARPVHEKQKD